MNKRILGGLAAAAMLAGGLAITSAGTIAAADAEPQEGVCPQYDTGHQSANDQTEFTYTAPEGQVIVALCVKAGSIKQGDGPENVPEAVGETSYTFDHSSGKEISHFSVDLASVPKPAPVVSEVFDCKSPLIVTVTTTPYVWSMEQAAWVLGVPVVSTKASTQVQMDSCETTTPENPTPTPETPATPPTNEVVAALPPVQAAPAQAVAPAQAAPVPTALPSTGIDSTGVTALIALLLTSLGGAALFMSRRYNVTN